MKYGGTVKCELRLSAGRQACHTYVFCIFLKMQVASERRGVKVRDSDRLRERTGVRGRVREEGDAGRPCVVVLACQIAGVCYWSKVTAETACLWSAPLPPNTVTLTTLCAALCGRPNTTKGAATFTQ